MPDEKPVPPLAIKPTTFAKLFDCSLTTVYDLIKNGAIDTIDFGSDKRIPMESALRLHEKGWRKPRKPAPKTESEPASAA
jgi:hypothetical protein